MFTLFANMVMYIHTVWVGLIAILPFISLVWRVIAPYYIIMAVLTLAGQVMYKGECPLTNVERWLRANSDNPLDERSFTERIFGIEIKPGVIAGYIVLSIILVILGGVL